MTNDQKEDREMALGHWQEHIHQLRLLVEHADEFTPSEFVKSVDKFMTELRSAAMGTVIHVLNRPWPEEKTMIINKDNDGKPIGFIETLISNERVVTVNATRQAATITTRDRSNGKVKTETFFGTLPLPK
jgi:hypothetical protein